MLMTMEKDLILIAKKDHGIGLMNIESRVESVNGTIHFEAEVKKGTVVTVNIPI